ncbi:MAG: indolepyruvate oxidoreductase subunit beta [Candidatus Thorarchaeota archaeon]|jgi:indolepyruvate ferredoxin oxidoreductase beta subunit
MTGPFNLMIAGVGGQGNLVCGRSLAKAAMAKGLRPVLGDTFGASRRGGSVVTHLRISERDLGSLIPKGHLHIILGMEPIESLRSVINFGGPETIAVFSTLPVQSPATLSGDEKYPTIDEITKSLTDLCSQVYALDARPVIEEAGTHRVLNVYMLGALVGLEVTPLDRDSIETSIDDLVGLDDKNCTAFESGISDGQRLRST